MTSLDITHRAKADNKKTGMTLDELGTLVPAMSRSPGSSRTACTSVGRCDGLDLLLPAGCDLRQILEDHLRK